MDSLECKIEHLQLSPGDIITVSGCTLDEFRHMAMGIDRVWRQERINEGVLFVFLPKDGALDIVSWERLQEWQRERLKDE